MAKILLQTASLVLNIKGSYTFPTAKNSKTATYKYLLKLLKEEDLEIQYLGYEPNRDPSANSITENCVVIAIHIIEDAREIDFFENRDKIIHHFVRHIKKNTSRILLQKQQSRNGFTQKQFDIYVRAVADPMRSNRNLKQA